MVFRGRLPVLSTLLASAVGAPTCPGSVLLRGYGPVALVPTGWADGRGAPPPLAVAGGRSMAPSIGSRAYFADACTAGVYDHTQYLALKLLGRRLRYTVDLAGAGCGCNAAFYLTSMRQNADASTCSDYYCDANSVCGVACAEIDVQEANLFSFHATLHTGDDRYGVGGGYGGGGPAWSGPRDWTGAQYGPGGACVDTRHPFNVSAAFPVDTAGALRGVEVMLSQDGMPCAVSTNVSSYKGMAELSAALQDGMTPIVSYWSADDMLWMDGEGSDHRGRCAADSKANCGDSVKFYDFSVEAVQDGAASDVSAAPAPAPALGSAPGPAAVAAAAAAGATMEGLAGAEASAAATETSPPATPISALGDATCAGHGEDCTHLQCCSEPGKQCYVKNQWFSACRDTCEPGSFSPEDSKAFQTPWSCVRLGRRASKADVADSTNATVRGVSAVTWENFQAYYSKNDPPLAAPPRKWHWARQSTCTMVFLAVFMAILLVVRCPAVGCERGGGPGEVEIARLLPATDLP